MGCDWVHPKVYKPNVAVSEASLYCHLETANGKEDIKKGDTLFGPSARCTLNNWLAYFSFGDQMVGAEISNTTAIIVVSLPTGRLARLDVCVDLVELNDATVRAACRS